MVQKGNNLEPFLAICVSSLRRGHAKIERGRHMLIFSVYFSSLKNVLAEASTRGRGESSPSGPLEGAMTSDGEERAVPRPSTANPDRPYRHKERFRVGETSASSAEVGPMSGGHA